jgi:hypothetical protein
MMQFGATVVDIFDIDIWGGCLILGLLIASLASAVQDVAAGSHRPAAYTGYNFAQDRLILYEPEFEQ